jgi:hypothetical protein
VGDRAKFTNKLDARQEDLQFTEDERIAEDDRRFSTSEIAEDGHYGILTGLTLSNPSAYTLHVAAGVAYDDLGRTLRVITGDPFSNRAEPLSLTFTGGDGGKKITLAYNETDTDDVTHPITGAPTKTRTRYYPTVQLRSGTPPAHEVIIGAIGTIDGSGNCSFDLSLAQYWGARLTPLQLQELADALFEATSHQQEDHVAGIEAIGPSGDPGAITIDGSPTPDKAVVKNTVSKDSVLINGVRLYGAGKFDASTTDVTFLDGAVTANPQLWALRVNNAGEVGKTLAAQYNAPQVVVGLQIVDLCPLGIPYPSGTLTIDEFEATGTYFLRIAGNATISPTSDGLYLLRTDDDPDIAVLVYVTIGSLPTGGSTGSPHQDVITVDPTIYDLPPGTPARFDIDNPPVTITDSDGNSGCWFLGYVWWYGTGLNLLGYGTWATTGQAYDKRTKGNLNVGQTSDAFRAHLTRLLTETRADGFVGPPLLVYSGGSLNVLATRSDARNDIDASEKSVYAYIGGNRVRVPSTRFLTLSASLAQVIYLQDNGDGTSTWGHQTGSGTIGIPLGVGKMAVWNVTTNGSGVTAFEDVSVTLPRIDREAVRLNRTNDGDLDIGGTGRIRGNLQTNGTFSSDGKATLNDALDVYKQLTQGLGLIGTKANALSVQRGLPIALNATSNRTRVDSVLDAFGVPFGWALYVLNPDDLAPSFELVLNAEFHTDGQWHRQKTGHHSAILQLNPDGSMHWARRDSGSANTWTDTYDGTGWSELVLNAFFSGGLATLLVDQLAVANGSSIALLNGLSVTGSIEATINIHADQDLISDRDANIGRDANITRNVGISGRIDAATGLRNTEIVFTTDGFTGAGPVDLIYAPSRTALIRAQDGKIRGVTVYASNNVDAGRTVRFKVIRQIFDNTFTPTSSTVLKQIDIVAGDYANLVDGINLDIDYATAVSSVGIRVTAETIGGTLGSGVFLTCILQLQQ